MSYGDYLRNKYHHAAVKIADAEGVPCVLEYSKGKNIRNYEIYGNSVQDGAPSVDSPVEIQSVGDLVTDTESEYYGKYDVPVTVCGKNLLKYPYYWTSSTRSGITFTVNGDGTVTLNGTTTLSGTSVDDFILAHKTKIESGTYTVSGCPSGGSTRKYRIFLHIKDSSGNPKYISDIGNGATFTVTDTSTMTASIRIEAEIGTVNNLVFAPQIELGSTATEYELYKGETKHIYLDEPLKKVGDYADYIDFKNQKVVRNAAETILTGSETWGKTSDTSEGVYQGFCISNSAYNIPKGNNLACFSNKFPYLSLSSAAEKNTIRMGKNSAYTLRIIIGAEYVPDLELSTFKTWLSTNNVKIVYPLAAPTEESIALPALKTFKGTSIISADTAVLPSNIKVKYVRT